MSTAMAPTSTAIVKSKAENVRGLLEKLKPQIKLALPRHMDADRLLRIAMTSIQRTPKLLDCDPTSLLAAVIQSAQLGLEPDGALGHAYLVPYKTKGGGSVVQFIPGYRGLVDLARRSGQLSTITAHVVYERDSFRYAFGIDETIVHTPYDGDDDPGPMRHVYAVAKLRDGGVQTIVLTRREVNAVRARSRAADSGPWVTDEAEMWKKTALRRLCKLLPMSVEMARAVALDEQADAGLPQDIGEAIGAVVEEVTPPPAKTAGDLLRKSDPEPEPDREPGSDG